MKCLILAAGYATRLYPLTENFPKPLLKVGEKTILDWLIDDIDTTGVVGFFKLPLCLIRTYVDESLIPEGYVDRISSIVRTRVTFSRSVQGCQFFTAIQNALGK